MPVAFPVPKNLTSNNPSQGTKFTVGGQEIKSSSSLGKGSAVALTLVGSEMQYLPCGARISDLGLKFFGFLQDAVAAGSVPIVIFGRGAIFEPIVEGGVALEVGKPVFLSLSVGKVTQTVINDTDAVNLCVGYAVSSTSIVFITDNRFLL